MKLPHQFGQIFGFGLAGLLPLASLASPPPSVSPSPGASVRSAEQPFAPEVFFSPSLREVARMAQAGIDASVLRAFITHSAGTFNLGADQVIYLNDLGVPGDIVSAMIEHDQALASGALASTASTVPGPEVNFSDSAAAQPVLTGAAGQQPPETDPAYSFFREALAPYGCWVNLPSYGWCWQPNVARTQADWHPYRQAGRWLSTDCGWYWASDYAWGGVAFHYGRWVRDAERGWCWWPEQRWAPAWVTWRTSESDCGWAPLPPFTGLSETGSGLVYYGSSVPWTFDFYLDEESFTFVPWRRLLSQRPSRSCFTEELAGQAFYDSSPLNDLFLDQQSRVVNRGAPLSQFLAASQRTVITVPIRAVPAASATTVEPDRFVLEEERLVIEHPVAAATGTERLAQQSTVATTPAVTLPQTWTSTQPSAFVGRFPPYSPAVPAVAPAQTGEVFGEFPLANPEPLLPTGLKIHGYNVRAPYPVQLTDPIILPKPYQGRVPNWIIIEGF